MHLGTQLVVRTSRKLLLTDAGAAFVVASRRVLEDLDNAERAASGEYQAPRGDLLVTASIMFGKLHVTPIAIDFLKAYPDVNLRVVLADHVIDLVENHVDAAIRIGHLPDSLLIASKMGEVHWVICASPDYLARRGIPLTPGDLNLHDCLGFEGLQLARTWPFLVDGKATEVRIRPRFSSSTADTIIAAAIAGVGIARITSYQAAAAMRDGTLVAILGECTSTAIPVHLVHTGPPLLPLKLRAFLDFATPRLKAALDGLPTSRRFASPIC